MSFLNLLVGAIRGTGKGSSLAMITAEGSNVRDIPIDLVLNEVHVMENQVTEHPVETGASITDHIRPRPLKLSLTGIFSDTAISLLDRFERVRAGEPHTIRAVQFFEELRDKGYLVDINNRLKSYNNMAVESVTFSRSGSSGKSAAMTVQFKEVTFVESEVLVGGSSLLAGLSGATAKLGKIATSSPSASTASSGASVLSRITGLGG
jgi:hypothetical protein